MSECKEHSDFYDFCWPCKYESLESQLRAAHQEIEDLIWNLAACSTFALGYGIDEPFDKTKARPAVYDVLNIRKAVNAADELAKLCKNAESYYFWPEMNEALAAYEKARGQ